MTAPLPTVASAGYQVVDSGLSAAELDAIRTIMTPVLAAHGERGAVRNVAARAPELVPVVAGALKALARPHFDGEPFAVRILLFDKTPLANWKATWHQDVTIAVTEYADLPGWGPWSRKDGTWHVRPPDSVLEEMLTVRLHLDACNATNGPVRVIPGTHRLGRLGEDGIEAAIRHAVPVDCLVPAGGALLMRPLVLHSSAPASAPTHRRVLHAEFASRPLPDGFVWAERDGKPAMTE